MQHIKCVVVGDGNVGKTCLLLCYSTNTFKEEHIPTIFDNYKTTILINERHIELGLWDTAGQEDYDRFRPLSYPQTDVFLVCFSIAHRASLVNVTEKWIPEIRHYCPDTPVVLVGTKLDIREEEYHRHKHLPKNNEFVMCQEGQNLANRLRAVSYVECSSKTQEGLNKVFEEAVKAVICPTKYKPRPKKKSCIII